LAKIQGNFDSFLAKIQGNFGVKLAKIQGNLFLALNMGFHFSAKIDIFE
jgi:hypothetical protein